MFVNPTADSCRTAEASRAWARRVTGAADVEPAIREALAFTATGRLALLDIATMPD